MLHRFAQFVAGCTVLLVLAGSLVTSTGSGLAVPDWPTTYGSNMFLFPPSKWVGGILYEHGQRLIASTVGFLTIVLAVWLWLREPRRWVSRVRSSGVSSQPFSTTSGSKPRSSAMASAAPYRPALYADTTSVRAMVVARPSHRSVPDW